MTLVEEVQLRRAEEQVRSVRPLRRQDPDEERLVVRRRCYRCEAPIGEREPPGTRMCMLCRALGYVAHPCLVCERVLHRRDVTTKSHALRHVCQGCRRTIGENLPGAPDPDFPLTSKQDRRRALARSRGRRARTKAAR